MNFDRVASIYDATRSLPEGIPERIAEAIVAATNARETAQFLEIGVGTGRIALPLIQREYSYIGVDISHNMVEQLQAKVGNRYSNLRLVNADITNLPLPNESVDIVLNVHVLHLIPEWRRALDEAIRVLRPGGYFVEGHDGSLPGDPGEVMRAKWRELVEERGVELRPSYGTWSAVVAELTDRGHRVATYHVAQWEQQIRPRDILDEQRNRVFSLSWSVPDDVLASVHERMLEWATAEYGDLDKPLKTGWEFTLTVSRIPKST